LSAAAGKLRLDKWLWHARFFKTRSLAATRVQEGAVRINGNPTTKRAAVVGPGDVLTFSQEDRIRVVRIEGIGLRRGPAPEAQALYTDLSPPVAAGQNDDPENPAFDGKGRPTKRDRRQLDLSRSRHLE
jgi:ribosome-associated heat shock protein Hsp15